jgi:heme exporter protein D|tara:strand:- start:7464 stop:7682 length:219 start_codon:yes stop_codon:yes gene_type:complete
MMQMYFASFQDLLIMDGHGIYVWSAVILSLLVLVWLIVVPLLSRRALLKDIARDVLRERARQSSSKNNQGEV